MCGTELNGMFRRVYRSVQGIGMSKRDTYRDTLAYALAIAGSEQALAEKLKVTVPRLENWLGGIEEIPDRVFLAAVDVVADASREAIIRSRELLTKAPKHS